MSKGKTLRQITIGSTCYLWVVRRIDPHFVVLFAWARERKRRDFPLEVRLHYDDPWLHFGDSITAPPDRLDEVFQLVPITPGSVRLIIEAAIRAGWGPHHPPDCRLFERGEAGDLIPTTNPRVAGINPWGSENRTQ
jgi:hypothetical protein